MLKVNRVWARIAMNVVFAFGILCVAPAVRASAEEEFNYYAGQLEAQCAPYPPTQACLDEFWTPIWNPLFIEALSLDSQINDPGWPVYYFYFTEEALVKIVRYQYLQDLLTLIDQAWTIP